MVGSHARPLLPDRWWTCTPPSPRGPGPLPWRHGECAHWRGNVVDLVEPTLPSDEPSFALSLLAVQTSAVTNGVVDVGNRGATRRGVGEPRKFLGIGTRLSQWRSASFEHDTIACLAPG